MMDGDKEVMGRIITELREEDRADKQREVTERMVKVGQEGVVEKKVAGGVKGAQAYSAGRVNGQQQQQVKGGVNGASSGGKVTLGSGSGKVQGQNNGVQSERVEKSDKVREATAVAKG